MAQLQRLVIGAPFGNWFRRIGVTSTLGTFTHKHRGNFWYRLWRVLWTCRYSWRMRGWINKLGLPSPALTDYVFANRQRDFSRDVVSIHGFEWAEYRDLLQTVSSMQPLAVELNLSCPNVCSDFPRQLVSEALEAVRSGIPVIAKLAPLHWLPVAEDLIGVGIRCFHCCNTIPCPSGGLSGKVLKKYSMAAVADLRRRWGSLPVIIGGGGVTCLQDVRDYMSAGADHVAVASMLFNPFNWRKLVEFRDYLEHTHGPAPSFENGS